MQEAQTNPIPAEPSRALQVPIFRNLWVANLASNLGTMIQLVGASWLMVSLTDSATLVALVQSSMALPVMFFSLLAGAIADNRDRRLIMLTAQVFMLLISLTLALLAFSGLLSPWSLLLCTFLIGCGTALNGPALQVSMAELVPRPLLPDAVSLNAMGMNIARSAGPTLGGFIVAVAGAAFAFLVNGMSYFAIILVLSRWRPERAERTLPPESVALAMRSGLRYAANSPALMRLLTRSAVHGFATSSLPALMPLVARDLVGGGPLTYGVLLGAFGAGAVAGGLANGRLRRNLSTEQIMRVAILFLAGGAAIVGLSTSLPLTIAAFFLAGMGSLVSIATFNVSVQLSTPRWVVARAIALFQMSAFGGIAAGSWLYGEIATLYGVASTMDIAAVVLCATLIVAFRFPIQDTEHTDLAPLSRHRVPSTVKPIDPQTGPIVVTIEYRIPSKNVSDFLTLMAERRRILVRDGARGWALLRDITDDELWIERYHVPTWLEYMRHHQRRTKADDDIHTRIRELHHGQEPPVVRWLIKWQPGSLPTQPPVATDTGTAFPSSP